MGLVLLEHFILEPYEHWCGEVQTVWRSHLEEEQAGLEWASDSYEPIQ